MTFIAIHWTDHIVIQKPTYTISPFCETDLIANNALHDSDFATHYCDSRFGIGNWKFTPNGRQAIKMALESYALEKFDLVTILTTSGNFYISSCVTSTIEEICQWNRELTSDTKIVLVNHEFGYPYPAMEKLLATGLPIIEDCCTTFFSQDENSKVGKYGDYATYSFPKFFPIEYGGMLVSNKNKISPPFLGEAQIRYVKNTMSHQLQNEAGLIETRGRNFEIAATMFESFGFTQRFEKDDKIVPSVLMLNNNSIVKDLNQLKAYLTAQGIECSVFYGEDAFFLPTHQNLNPSDYTYFWNCINRFLQSEI